MGSEANLENKFIFHNAKKLFPSDVVLNAREFPALILAISDILVTNVL
jgi:hypothetical protein